MPFRLSRIPRPVAVAATALIAVAGVGFSASAAQAETRSGDVTVSMPSRIVLDGSTFPVTVSSTSMYSSLDKVYATIYLGTAFQRTKEVSPNTPTQVSSSGIQPGQLVAKADLATTDCDYSSSDLCFWNSDYTEYYEFIHGLTFHDSTPATAKYGSTVTLTAENDGRSVTWTARAQRWSGYTWSAWSGADVSIGGNHITSDGDGIATWVEQTSSRNTYAASASESDTVWSATSAAVTAPEPPAPTAAAPTTPPAASTKPGHVTPSATASKAATAMKKGLTSVRKVVTLTKKNDVNKLLGKKNGYVSAAVLYDKRTTCSDGPGVDCGATIEKFTSTSKAKARAKHIQALLKKYSFLGTEFDTVRGHFLLRVSGELTSSQAKQYKTVFGKTFR